MPYKYTNANFTEHGAFLLINGVQCSVDTKASLLLEGLCVVTGDLDLAYELNNTPSPDNEEVLGCADPQLVELALSYYRWQLAGAPINQGGRQGILNPKSASAVVVQHLEFINNNPSFVA